MQNMQDIQNMQNIQDMQNMHNTQTVQNMQNILHSESTSEIGSLCNPTVTPSSKVVIPTFFNHLAFVSLAGLEVRWLGAC